MVHLYMMTRGIKERVDRFVKHMETQYLPYKNKRIFPNTENNSGFLQVAMRPIQMWEVCFPEEHLQEVMRWIWLPEEINKGMRPEFKLPLYSMRKVLGAKKIPKLDEQTPLTRVIPVDNVCAYPIGIREDQKDENGDEDI